MLLFCAVGDRTPQAIYADAIFLLMVRRQAFLSLLLCPSLLIAIALPDTHRAAPHVHRKFVPDRCLQRNNLSNARNSRKFSPASYPIREHRAAEFVQRRRAAKY